MSRVLFSFSNAALLLCLFAAGCGLATGQSISESSIWWAPYLQLASLSDVARALDQPIMDGGRPTNLTLVNAAGQSKTVRTCNEFLDAVDQKMGPANQSAPIYPFITHCYPLRYLKSVQTPRQNFLGGGWTVDALKRLPPFVVYAESSLVTKASEARAKGESWEQFDPQMKILSHTDQELAIEDGQDQWRLTIVARGDFNQDGLEDEVVLACDRVRGGSGGLCLPLVLTASSPQQVMTLISSFSEPYNIVGSSNGTR